VAWFQKRPLSASPSSALAGVVVHAVEASAANATTNQTVTCFHTIFHATARINKAESEVLADSRQITPDYAGYLRIGKLVSVLVPALVPVADSLPPKPKLHTQLELEARVGIGRLTPCWRSEYGWLHWGFQ